MGTSRVGLVVLIAGLLGCGSTPGPSDGGAAGGGAAGGGAAGGGAAGGGAAGGGAAGGGAGVWSPAPLTSWQWQLSGTLDTTVNVQVYDIDLFDHAASVIAALHAQGRKVVCYFDTAYEPGRPDSSQFTAAVLGNGIAGWPGQKWVDFRSSVVRDIMKGRFDLARTKGCDGVEADDVDAVSNNPGFPLTAADQLDFCRFLATEAHSRGLAIGLKNNLDQVPQLVGNFDFAVNEECWKYNECAALAPFIQAGKAVFHAEYEPMSSLATICAVTKPMRLSTILKTIDLTAFRLACP